MACIVLPAISSMLLQGRLNSTLVGIYTVQRNSNRRSYLLGSLGFLVDNMLTKQAIISLAMYTTFPE